MSSFKTQNKKLHPGTVIIGENGLPVDTIATVSASYPLVQGVNGALTFVAGLVTVPVGVDLTPVRYHKARYTGRLILQTRDKLIYFIDRVSVDPATRTLRVYVTADQTSIPASIDLLPGWIIAEAELVNRLATSSQAKIDRVEFNDMQFQFELDGEDQIQVVGENGNTIEPNPDGSVNAVLDLPGSPTILNVPLPASNTQYTIVVPAAAKKYCLRSRDPARLRIRYSGQAPYITVPYGASYSESDLALSSSLQLSVESNLPNQIVELLYWE